MTIADTVRAFLRAIEAGDLDAVAAFYDPEIEVVEHPNRLNPTGKRYDREQLRAAGERGKQVLQRQHYEVRAVIVDGERAVAQSVWSGVLAVAVGPLPVGHEMKAQICSVFEFRAGKILRQEQYDCFV